MNLDIKEMKIVFFIREIKYKKENLIVFLLIQNEKMDLVQTTIGNKMRVCVKALNYIKLGNISFF